MPKDNPDKNALPRPEDIETAIRDVSKGQAASDPPEKIF